MLVIPGYDETETLKVENLAADWKRLQTGDLCIDVREAKQLSSLNQKNAGTFTMRYGFFYTEPDQLINVLVDE